MATSGGAGRYTRREFVKTFGGAAAALAVLPGALAACGGNKNQAATQRPSRKSGGYPVTTIGTARGAGQAAVVDYAIYKGIFAKRGAPTKLQFFSSGAALGPAVVANDLQVAIDGDIPTMPIVYQDSAVRVLCPLAMYAADQGIIAQKGISSVQQLVGMNVGLVIGSTAEILLDAAAQQVGVDASKINVLNMDPPSQIAAFSRGDISAYVSWQPYLAEGVEKLPNAHVLLTANQPTSLLSTYELLIAHESWVSSHRAQLEDVLGAMVDALKEINASKPWNSVAQSVTVEEAPGIPNASLASFAAARTYTMSIDSAFVNAETYIADFLQRKGKIPKVRPFTDFLDMEPLRAVDSSLVTI